MRPSFTVEDTLHLRAADPIAIGNILSRSWDNGAFRTIAKGMSPWLHFWFAANVPYRILGYFCHRIFRAYAGSLFLGCIAHIIPLISDKQVIWIDAWPHVAFMQDAKPLGNWTTMDNPRKPMGKENSLIGSRRAHVSVSLAMDAVLPYPASIAINNNALFELFSCQRNHD